MELYIVDFSIKEDPEKTKCYMYMNFFIHTKLEIWIRELCKNGYVLNLFGRLFSSMSKT